MEQAHEGVRKVLHDVEQGGRNEIPDTVELTVDELDFSATEAEHLRAALREAAEEYATGEVKVLCEDGWCIEKNDARIRAALLGTMLSTQDDV